MGVGRGYVRDWNSLNEIGTLIIIKTNKNREHF